MLQKKFSFYFYGSWERGKWRNIACLHSCVGIRWFPTSQTCQHHKLVNIIYLSNTTYNMSAKESFKSEVCDCHQKCTSLLTTMTRGHCLLICVCQPFVTGNLSSPATKRSRPSIQVQEEPFWMLMPVIVVVIIMNMMMLRRTPHCCKYPSRAGAPGKVDLCRSLTSYRWWQHFV